MASAIPPASNHPKHQEPVTFTKSEERALSFGAEDGASLPIGFNNPNWDSAIMYSDLAGRLAKRQLALAVVQFWGLNIYTHGTASCILRFEFDII